MARLKTAIGRGRRVAIRLDQPEYLWGLPDKYKPTPPANPAPSPHDVAEHQGRVPQVGVPSGPRQTVAPSPSAPAGTPAVYTPPPLVHLGPPSRADRSLIPGLIDLGSPLEGVTSPVKGTLGGQIAGLPGAIEDTTLGDQSLEQILASGREGTLQINKGGLATTPAVRQALQGVNQAGSYLRKTARPDLSGLAPEERAVVPYVMRAHHEYPDVPSSVLMSDIRQESGFDPLAKSSAGAGGLSQFIPGTAASYGVQYGASPQAQQSQVSGQAHYLHDLGFAKDPQAALSSYSGGYAAADYNNPVLAGAGDYKALDRPSRPAPQAVHQYQRAAADARSLGLKPTSLKAAQTPWGGDLEPGGRPDTVYVRADGKGMVNWAESALGTKEGSSRQLNINAKSGIAPSEPWCAAFIAAGLRRRGIEPPSGPAFSGSYHASKWPGARSLGTDLSKAKPGDVVIFGSDEHIGLYVGSGQVIAGNWGDEVARYAAVDDSRGISEIVRPPYKGGKVAVHSAAPLPGGSPSSAFGTGAAVPAVAGAPGGALSPGGQQPPIAPLTQLQAPVSAGPVLAGPQQPEPNEDELLALLSGGDLATVSARRPRYGAIG